MLKFEIKPFKLRSNRVWRTYKGGLKLEEWLGAQMPKDGQFPEDWVASVVKARNPGREDVKDEGLSEIIDENFPFTTLKELLEVYPKELLGEVHVRQFGNTTGMLVKVLNSSERLTIQVHPDNTTAMNLFNSSYGKTEAWYIIGEQNIDGEPPYILLGFKPGITREHWMSLFEKQDIQGMQDALHKFYVKKGDVFLINGGVPHAIGAGCFLVEIQEPTDYTIRTEKMSPSGVVVIDSLCHQGLGFEKMFDCFKYEGFEREEILGHWKLSKDENQLRDSEHVLISYEDTNKFAMDCIGVSKEHHLRVRDNFTVVIVVEGKGLLKWPTGTLSITRGEQIFLPYNVNELMIINTGAEKLKLVRCHPPQSC